MLIGGNSFERLIAEPIAPPSRTRTVASSTASRIGTLVTTEALMPSASSTGTPLELKILSVRVNLAVFKPPRDPADQR